MGVLTLNKKLVKICKVSSLPINEVIEGLANSFEVTCKEKCGEYILDIPSRYGAGQIRGLNFDNGLGVIIYTCKFYSDIRIDFTVDDIHPIKYIYSLKGAIQHSFENELETHYLDQYKCAIVASESKNGHILFFEKDIEIKVVSLEINRRKFLVNAACQIDELGSQLQQLYQDTSAKRKFYHEGYFGLEFNELLTNISKYKDRMLIRKFYLESVGLQIFVHQLVQFEDDLLNDSERCILRVNELNSIEGISNFIKDNLTDDLSIVHISKRTGLNPNKLQIGFKHLYGTTVHDYIIKIKLEKACELMENHNLNVSDVAVQVGFDSKSHFSKIFKKKFNITPSAYQQLYLK